MTDIRLGLLAFFDQSSQILNEYLTALDRLGEDKKAQTAEYYSTCSKLTASLLSLDNTTLDICSSIRESDERGEYGQMQELSRYLDTALSARKNFEEFLSSTELIIRSCERDIAQKLRAQLDILIRKEFLLKSSL